MLKDGFGEDSVLSSDKRCTAGIRNNVFQLCTPVTYKPLSIIASQTLLPFMTSVKMECRRVSVPVVHSTLQ